MTLCDGSGNGGNPLTDTAAAALLVTPERAAEMLSIPRSRIYALMRTGEIPSVLVGRSRRVTVRSLEDWVGRLAREDPK